jgi:hypothetical protein
MPPGAPYDVQGSSAGHLFDDDEGYGSCSLGDDNDRSLLHCLIAFIADDEPAPFSLGSPRPRLTATQDKRGQTCRWGVRGT